MLLLLGYTLLALTLLLLAAANLGWTDPQPLSPLVAALLFMNLGFFVWRAIWRFVFTARNYGVKEGVLAVLRIPVTNLVAIMAGHRAVVAYMRALAGGALEWDKTPHDRHPAGEALPITPARPVQA